MPQIILKQDGQPVAEFAFNGTTVTVAGVSVDCAERLLDVAVAVEIRKNKAGPSEGGNGAYLAQINIPARRYARQENISADMTGNSDQSFVVHEAMPLDPNAVQVTLWPTA